MLSFKRYSFQLNTYIKHNDNIFLIKTNFSAKLFTLIQRKNKCIPHILNKSFIFFNMSLKKIVGGDPAVMRADLVKMKAKVFGNQKIIPLKSLFPAICVPFLSKPYQIPNLMRKEATEKPINNVFLYNH